MFWRLIPLMILAFALQTTWFGGLRLGSAPLNLVFGVALCGAMLGGARVGFWCGLGAGYLMGLGAMWHPGSFLVSHLLPCVLVGLAASKFEVSLAGFGGDSWDFPESNSVSFAFADRVFSGVLGHFDVVANRGASAAELASVRACSSFRGAAPRVGLELKANFYATFALKSSRTGTVYTLQSPQNLFA